MKLLIVLFLLAPHKLPRHKTPPHKIICYNSTIKHDSATGNIVRLCDESVWKVNDRHTDVAQFWKHDEPIEVCGNKLTNLNRDEHVFAVRTQ